MQEFFSKRRNKTFYTTLVAQILVAIQLVLAIFNQDFLLDAMLQSKILSAVNGLLVILSTLGIVNNPTVPGVGDTPKDSEDFSSEENEKL